MFLFETPPDPVPPLLFHHLRLLHPPPLLFRYPPCPSPSVPASLSVHLCLGLASVLNGRADGRLCGARLQRVQHLCVWHNVHCVERVPGVLLLEQLHDNLRRRQHRLRHFIPRQVVQERVQRRLQWGHLFLNTQPDQAQNLTRRLKQFIHCAI